MVALLGGDAGAVRALAARLALTVANDNAPGQVVLSGALVDIEQAEQVARDETGARARRLVVGGAFHSPLMEPAAARLATALARTPVHTPAIPVYANGTAAPFADVRRELAAEPAAPGALARDAAGAARRGRRAVRRAGARVSADGPGQAHAGGGVRASARIRR